MTSSNCAGAMDRDPVKPCPVFMWGYQSYNQQKELDCIIDVGFIMVIFNAICLYNVCFFSRLNFCELA